jgi:hypothetical protein
MPSPLKLPTGFSGSLLKKVGINILKGMTISLEIKVDMARIKRTLKKPQIRMISIYYTVM